MKPKPSSETVGFERPARWLTRPPGDADASDEDRAAQLLRAGDWQPVLDSAARARVFDQVRAASRQQVRAASRQQVRAASRGRVRRRPTLTWAFAAAIVLTSAGLIASATVGHWPRLFSPTVTPIPSPAPATQKTKGVKGARRVAAADPGDAEPTAPLPVPVPVATDEPAVVPLPPPVVANPRPLVAARLPTAKAHSTLSEESQLLGQAMVQLRQQRDAEAALAALDQYAARFPRGTLKREATIARVDALLMLKRDRGALALLKQLDLQAQQRDQELRVIRGELTASESCATAIADFDRVLTESPDPTLIQRALYGRAGCRLRRGDSAGATRDLDQYLQQFPHGRFAAEARQTRAAAQASKREPSQ